MVHEEIWFRDGERIINEGSSDKHIYIILDGKCDVFVRNTKIRQCGAGEVLGIISAFKGKPRSASVAAIGEVKALKIRVHDIKTFADSLMKSEALMNSVLVSLIKAVEDNSNALDSISRHAQDNFDRQAKALDRATRSIETLTFRARQLETRDRDKILEGLTKIEQALSDASREIVELQNKLSNPAQR